MLTLLWIVQVLMAFVFLMTGGMKLISSKEELEKKLAWTKDYSSESLKAIGLVELACSAGLVLPLFLDLPEILMPISAAVLGFVMLACILLVHIPRKEGPAGWGLPLVLLVSAAFVVYVWQAPVVVEEVPVMEQPTIDEPGTDEQVVLPEGPVFLTSPEMGAEVSSPVRVAGEAPGFWFFEAQMGVKILDANGKQVGYGTATALDDWMTEELVGFELDITYTVDTRQEGMIVVVKDNPSGLAENDASYEWPVILLP